MGLHSAVTTSPRVLLVDGHSVIFRWPELTALHRTRMERARNALVQQLTAYQDATGVHVVVVFDGKGSHISSDTNPTNAIQVFYSRSNQTADSVIERIVAKYAGKYRVTVATDDHLEQQTTLSLGGEIISTDQLRDDLRHAEMDLRKQIAELQRRKG